MNLYCLIPVLVGAGITWLVSWLYYRKAGDELKRESAKLMQESLELERLNRLLLHGLENARTMELVKDASGKPTGIVIEISATMTGDGSISSRGEVAQRKSPSHDVTDIGPKDCSERSG